MYTIDPVKVRLEKPSWEELPLWGKTHHIRQAMANAVEISSNHHAHTLNDLSISRLILGLGLFSEKAQRTWRRSFPRDITVRQFFIHIPTPPLPSLEVGQAKYAIPCVIDKTIAGTGIEQNSERGISGVGNWA